MIIQIGSIIFQKLGLWNKASHVWLLAVLLQVTLEQCPSEVFIHVSASKCWELVRERVNSEISRQRIMGRFNLSSLEPLESIDGLKMFGLTSPDIIQVIFISRNLLLQNFYIYVQFIMQSHLLPDLRFIQAQTHYVVL